MSGFIAEAAISDDSGDNVSLTKVIARCADLADAFAEFRAQIERRLGALERGKARAGPVAYCLSAATASPGGTIGRCPEQHPKPAGLYLSGGRGGCLFMIERVADSLPFPPRLPVVVGEWLRNRPDLLRVSLDRFNGREIVDIRTWFPDGEGGWRPSRSGITLSVMPFPILARTLPGGRA